MEKVIVAQVAGIVTQGQPLGKSDEALQLPAMLIETRERVYRVAGDALRAFGMESGDLLIVEPRDNEAQTSEVVLVRSRERVFVGRWWKKHGKRELRDMAGATIVRERSARIFGAVTLIVRMPADAPESRE